MPLNANRRKNLLTILPEGMILSRKYLLESGFTRHGIDNLVKSKQLQAHATGIYSRPGTLLTWQGVVHSLQMIYNDFIIGGITAMEMRGLAHYLPFSDQETVHLYGKSPLPKWVFNILPNVKWIGHIEKGPLGVHVESYIWQNTFSIGVSIPERAILEAMMEVPNTMTFEHADQLLQGFTNISPYKVQDFLMSCVNIKVRRLFLFLSEYRNYTWFRSLDLQKINLGSGNRVIVKGGKLNLKYKITIPKGYEQRHDLL